MKRKSIITGIERKKCIMSCRTFARGSMLLGKLIFFIMVTFPKKTIGEALTELENHCQGKSPAIRKTAYPSIWIRITTLKAIKKTKAKAKGWAIDQTYPKTVLLYLTFTSFWVRITIRSL
jgi:hypothetical protein